MKMDPTPPKVSIILSVYNAEGTIRVAIDSVLLQTIPDIELIICDDASTDQTFRIVSEIDDSRIILIRNDQNLGPGLSRDRAIKYARGHWLAMIDADDMWLPCRLEKLIEGVGSENSDFMIFDNLMLCFDSPTGMTPYKKLRYANSVISHGSQPIEFPIDEYLRFNQLLIKPLIPLKWVHRTMASHGDYRFGEDTRFFLQLLARGLRMKYLPEAMYYYRLMPGSLTTLRNRNFQMLQILEELRPMFLCSSHGVSGLDFKIQQVHKSMRYSHILSLLRTWHLRRFAYSVVLNLWFIPMFFQKLFIDLHYKFFGFLNQANIRR